MQKSKYQEYLALSEQMFKRFKENYNSKKWKKLKDKPCDLFTMEIEGHLASRGQTIINYPLQQVFKFLRYSDMSSDPDINKYEYLQKFKEDEHLYIQYIKYNSFMVVDGRDFVCLARAIHDGNFIYYFAESLPTYPKPQQKGMVRGHIITDGYVLQKIDDKRTKATYISDVDPKGLIPEFVKNILSQKQGKQVAQLEENMNKQKGLKK